MRFLTGLFVLGALAPVMAYPEGLPECTTHCMSTELVGTACNATDMPCLCAHENLQQKITACMFTTCTMKESLATRNITGNLCHVPTRDHGKISLIITSVFGIPALLVTAIRASQFVHQFGLEDVFAVIAMIAGIVMASMSYSAIHYGFGRDIWTIPYDNLTSILKLNWINQMFYIVCMSAAKLAFLCLYLRIFLNPTLRRAIFILMGIVMVYFLSFFFLIVFHCTPVSYVWTGWTGETQGSCISYNAIAVAAAATNIALDIAITVLPLGEVMKLNLKPIKKLLVMVMFCTGFFVIIVSIVRFKTVVAFAHGFNQTYDNIPMAYWSAIECYTAIICVSMPAVRRLFISIFSCCGPANSHATPTPRHRSKDLVILRTTDTRVSREPRPGQDSDTMNLVVVEHTGKVIQQ